MPSSIRLVTVSAVAVLCLAFIPAAAFSQDVSRNDRVGFATALRENSVIITINWHEAAASGGTPQQGADADQASEAAEIAPVRITSKSLVSYRVTNFNHFKYSIRYNVETQEIEAYQELATLWGQLLGIPGLLDQIPAQLRPVSGDPAPFFAALNAWEDEIEDKQAGLERFLNSFGTVGLTDAQVGEVRAQITLFAGGRQELSDLRSRTQALQGATEERLLFREVERAHTAYVQALATFVQLANVVVNGQQRAIGKKEAGTIVTVTLTPTNRSTVVQSESEPLAFDYFVHSDLPLLFHVGLAGSSLNDFEFETVQSLVGSDLFLKVKDESSRADLVAFLSYKLHGSNDGEGFGLFATLGTSFSDPGKTLFVGASGRYDRFVISAGGVSGEVVSEGNSVLEEVADELEVRELFDSITKRREWGVYLGLSVTLF